MNIEHRGLEKKESFLSYGVAWGIALMLVFFMIVTVARPLEKGNRSELVCALSNCFAVPAALLGGIGGLSLMARLGAYDGFVYSFKSFGIHNLVGGDPKAKRTQSFYDYKRQREKNGRKWLPEFLYVGLILLAVSIILSIVYLVI